MTNRVNGIQYSENVSLTYRGGRVLRNPTFYTTFVGSFWETTKGAGEMKRLDDFCRKLPRSEYTSIWKQYGAGGGDYKGMVSAPPIADSSSYVTESIVEKIVKNTALGSNAIRSEVSPVLTLMLPPGMILFMNDGTSSLGGVGGFHGSVKIKNGKTVYYAAIVHSEVGNGIPFMNNSVDNMTVATSHELSEVVTDPDVGHGNLGWYDNHLGEVSDIPVMLRAELSTIVDKIDGYYVQKNWSNVDRAIEAKARH